MIIIFLFTGCNNETFVKHNYYLVLSEQGDYWNLDSYKIEITPEKFKAGDGIVSVKNEPEYKINYFDLEVHAVINGEDKVIQRKAVTHVGGDTGISEIHNGSMEESNDLSKNGKAIKLNNISEVYAIIKWNGETGNKTMEEKINLYSKETSHKK